MKRTSVGNGSLIIGISPIVIALMSAMVGHERIRPVRWLGIAVAMFGLYLVVGHGVDLSGQTWRGDLLMMGGVICWATYSVASQSILKRHSPLIVIGADVLDRRRALRADDDADPDRVEWRAISGFSWLMMLTSALLALNLSVLDLVYGPEEARRLAHVGLQLPHAGRRDDGRGDLAGRADLRRTRSPAPGRFSRACSSRDSSTEPSS